MIIKFEVGDICKVLVDQECKNIKAGTLVIVLERDDVPYCGINGDLTDFIAINDEDLELVLATDEGTKGGAA